MQMRPGGNLHDGEIRVNLELRHARIVTLISELGSISKAAAQMGLPQPSLTAQLRRIEKALGGSLFIRSRSGVTPTPLGERIIPLLDGLVQQADTVLLEASTSGPASLRLGTTEWAPPLLRGALRNAVSVTDVQTETLPPAVAIEAVEQGALSAAIVPGSAYVPSFALRCSVIMREPVWLALPLGHPLAGLRVVDGSHFDALNWVRYSRDHWFYEIEKRVLAVHNLSGVEALHRVDGHHEAMSWVRDAHAVTLAPPTGAIPEVSLVPISGTESIEMLLVWRKGAVPDHTLRSLVDTIRAHYCEYALTIPGYWDWITQHPSEFPELSPFLPAPV